MSQLFLKMFKQKRKSPPERVGWKSLSISGRWQVRGLEEKQSLTWVCFFNAISLHGLSEVWLYLLCVLSSMMWSSGSYVGFVHRPLRHLLFVSWLNLPRHAEAAAGYVDPDPYRSSAHCNVSAAWQERGRENGTETQT